MQAIQILDIKSFMQILFQSTGLESYDFVSGEILTDMKYTIDGHINHDFFSDEELQQFSKNHSEYFPWAIAKEKIFHLIKGKKTPSSMKLVFRLQDDIMEEILSQNKQFTQNDIDGMFANLTFQNKKLNVICGISYKIFTTDKTLESDFSNYFITFLKSNQITHTL